jgi:hypothetical protein
MSFAILAQGTTRQDKSQQGASCSYLRVPANREYRYQDSSPPKATDNERPAACCQVADAHQANRLGVSQAASRLTAPQQQQISACMGPLLVHLVYDFSVPLAAYYTIELGI